MNTANEIDAVLTFDGLRKLFEKNNITPAKQSKFDPPNGGAGGLFSISRGMLQAADISEDLLKGDVVAVEGRSNFVEAIKEFSSGDMDARLLEVLCCEGCIMGPGISNQAPLFNRRSKVSRYVRNRMKSMDHVQWRADMMRFSELDLSRRFTADDQRIPVPSYDEVAEIMARMGKLSPEDELNCGACGYETCREHAIAIHKGLAENEMCLPNTIDQLRTTIGDLAISNEQLARAQEALMQSEKLASMGQLAAGIAHEVNNPLGVVLMYAHMLEEENRNSNEELSEDLKMIVQQANRCKKIVGGLLNFARQNKVILKPVDVCEMLDFTLKALAVPDNITIQIENNIKDPIAELDHDQIIQVLVNIFSNARAAMPDGGTLTVGTTGTEDMVCISVSDTGHGIPIENRSKIFAPFFTTKQMGKGTGLGLAVGYGIIKMHRGEIRFESNTDLAKGPTGTTFTLTLPRKPLQEKINGDTLASR